MPVRPEDQNDMEHMRQKILWLRLKCIVQRVCVRSLENARFDMEKVLCVLH